MIYSVHNIKGEQVKEINLNPEIFAVKANPDLIKQAVRVIQANARQVLAHTKTKGEVSGGGKKPWKQKGTGRARTGSIRNPNWVGGGVVFGPRNTRNFSLNINKKQRKKALFMALSDKAANKDMVLVSDLKLDEFKTRKMLEVLANLKLKENNSKESVLVVLPATDEKITKSINNISRVKTIRADSLNVLDVLKYKNLLLPIDAIEIIEKTYLK